MLRRVFKDIKQSFLLGRKLSGLLSVSFLQFLLPAIIGGLGAAIGGIQNNNAARIQAEAQEKSNEENQRRIQEYLDSVFLNQNTSGLESAAAQQFDKNVDALTAVTGARGLGNSSVGQAEISDLFAQVLANLSQSINADQFNRQQGALNAISGSQGQPFIDPNALNTGLGDVLGNALSGGAATFLGAYGADQARRDNTRANATPSTPNGTPLPSTAPIPAPRIPQSNNLTSLPSTPAPRIPQSNNLLQTQGLGNSLAANPDPNFSGADNALPLMLLLAMMNQNPQGSTSWGG